jgi:hypothetical protein
MAKHPVMTMGNRPREVPGDHACALTCSGMAGKVKMIVK